MKEDAIKIDFRGINKFYREKIKQEFFHPFKEDLISLPFDKISMRVAFVEAVAFRPSLITLIREKEMKGNAIDFQ